MSIDIASPKPDPLRALQNAALELQRVKQTPTVNLGLYLIQSVEHYLDHAETIQQLRVARDYAKMFAEYLKQHRMNLRDANALRAMQLRTDRRLGLMLAQAPREPGKRTDATSLPEVTRFQEILEELAVSRKTAFYWERLADIQEAEFNLFLEEQQKDGHELTTGAALEYWHKHYAPPTPSHDPGDNDGHVPPPDDREIDGEYQYSNYGANLEQLLAECDTVFETIMSLTAEPEILRLCQEQHDKIKDLFKEMVET